MEGPKKPELLEVGFPEQPTEEIPIDKKALVKAAKAAEEKEIARVRQQFNVRTMRVKTKLLADAGVEIEKWGVKNQGHGRLYCAGGIADKAIAAIEEEITRLSTSDAPKAAEVIAHLRMVQWRFNKQIIEVGQSHLEAAKEASSRGGSSDMRIAFPAGQPVVVAVSPVNATEKALTQGDGAP